MTTGLYLVFFFFFFNDTATTEIYTLSLHDALPIWRDETLVAQSGKDYGFTPAHAKKFLEALAGRLSLDPGHVIAAFEDVWQMVHQEQALPVNVDPLKADLKDPDERKRLARLLERGLGAATGYVLPLKPTDGRSSASVCTC